jgi:hypothetical protein
VSFKKSNKTQNGSTLENKCYATIGRFFNKRQVLWIEYATEMENLEAIALFFIYHWHSTYSDDEKEINKKVSEFADFASQHNLPKIELLITNDLIPNAPKMKPQQAFVKNSKNTQFTGKMQPKRLEEMYNLQ